MIRRLRAAWDALSGEAARREAEVRRLRAELDAARAEAAALERDSAAANAFTRGLLAGTHRLDVTLPLAEMQRLVAEREARQRDGIEAYRTRALESYR